jgi:hypothetical protein
MSWSGAGNTSGFDNLLRSGVDFFTGDFTMSGRSQVLFYYNGDGNWWLGSIGSSGDIIWKLMNNMVIKSTSKPSALFQEGGTVFTEESIDIVKVSVVEGAVALDSVEFVLRSSSNVHYPKEIQIVGAANTTYPFSPPIFSWLLATQGAMKEDKKIIKLMELTGGFLVLRKPNNFPYEPVRILGNTDTTQFASIKPGSRITFFWERG